MENETELKLFFWIGTAILLLSVLSVFLMITIYRSKIHKINRIKSDDLLNISLNSEKRERKRIASDLHDSISGDLSAVQNYIALLSSKEEDSFNKTIFREVETAIGNILENIQDISYNLMPPTLEKLGLISTLRSYFERIRKWNEITINEEYYAENITITSSDAYELYRIIQELITNILKHGKSNCIDFSIQGNEKYIIFQISDNGTSFDFYKCLKEPCGMGLKNITSRIKYIRAKLVQISSNKGNTIQIHLYTNNNVTNSYN
ncbi:Histidine kinase [Chryseobacterium taichungense]|uniref:histidine kinase n=1 Tax=Chryseobacterium taichungense TaxID=295069 RepID=A0A1H8A3R2_9FLAO|nr:ATP-binding protein [Chryseobacterium taichungense]SEM65221.1 Histidine kinase [Chryseobacterium taichungense]